MTRCAGRGWCSGRGGTPASRSARSRPPGSVAPRRRERVAKAGYAVVQPVVVGHRRHVDAAGREAANASGAPGTCTPWASAAPPRDRGLEVHDREVGAGGARPTGASTGFGVARELGPDHALEVDVSAEREDDGPSGGSPPRERLPLERGGRSITERAAARRRQSATASRTSANGGLASFTERLLAVVESPRLWLVAAAASGSIPRWPAVGVGSEPVRKGIVQLVAIGVVIGVPSRSSPSSSSGLPTSASEEFDRIQDIYWFATLISIVIFSLVAAVVVYSVWKWRVPPTTTPTGRRSTATRASRSCGRRCPRSS